MELYLSYTTYRIYIIDATLFCINCHVIGNNCDISNSCCIGTMIVIQSQYLSYLRSNLAQQYNYTKQLATINMDSSEAAENYACSEVF